MDPDRFSTQLSNNNINQGWDLNEDDIAMPDTFQLRANSNKFEESLNMLNNSSSLNADFKAQV